MKSPLPDAAVGKLTPTPTYSFRGFNWVRCPALQVGSVPIDGLLALRLKKFRGGEELDVYAVLYEGEQPFEGHAFLLHNVFDRDQPEPYRVCVGPVVTCTCKSGRTHAARECKHKSAVIALIYRSHTEVATMPGVKVYDEGLHHPNLGDVVLLKSERHISDDDRPRYTVVEKVTRERADETRVAYLLRTTSYKTSASQDEFSAVEIEREKAPAA